MILDSNIFYKCVSRKVAKHFIFPIIVFAANFEVLINESK